MHLDTLKTDDDNLDSFDSHSSALEDSIITEDLNSIEDSKVTTTIEKANLQNKISSKDCKLFKL